MKPHLWLIAGPNGSGKTTLVSTGVLSKISAIDPAHGLVTINPDVKALELRASGTADAPLKAAQWADDEMDRLIAAIQSFVRETVLSTDRLFPKFEAARAAGFTIFARFIPLRSPEINIDRVRQRVDLGGHDVPPDRIIKRWAKSIARISRLASLADNFFLFDNSKTGGDVSFLASKEAGVWRRYAALEHLRVDATVHSVVATALRVIDDKASR